MDGKPAVWVALIGKPMEGSEFSRKRLHGEGGEGGGEGLPAQYLENAAKFRRGNSAIRKGSASPASLRP